MAVRVEWVVPKKGFETQFRPEDRQRPMAVIVSELGKQAKDSKWLLLAREDGSIVRGPVGNIKFSDNWVEKVSNGP